MKTSSSLFTLAGMLFGRGSFINPSQNCIVLYLFNSENDFAKNIKEKFSEYNPVSKKIQFNKTELDNPIIGICISAKYGKIIKESLDIQKSNLLNREIPTKIINAGIEDVTNFLSGIFSMNCNIQKKGILFFRYPVITIKDTGIEALNIIKNMLERLEIKSEIDNRSSEKYIVGNKERIFPSVLSIKKEETKKFANKIEILNPQKTKKLLKTIF